MVTSSPGNGTTSFLLAFAENLIKSGVRVIYMDVSSSLSRDFVFQYYKNVFKYMIVLQNMTYLDFVSLIDECDIKDYTIIIDPGDSIMKFPNLFSPLFWMFKERNIRVICSSQIRQDPSQGGKPYSPLEKENLRRLRFGEPIFDYSIWIRNITTANIINKSKYIDVFRYARTGNNYIDRYLVKYSEEGNIIK